MSVRGFFCLVVFALLTLPGAAWAQPTPAADSLVTVVPNAEYGALAESARAAFIDRRYDEAVEFWRQAGERSAGQSEDEVIARANALTWQSASLILKGITQPRRTLNFRDARPALTLLLRADLLLESLPAVADEPGPLTARQAAFAANLAWRENIERRFPPPVHNRLLREAQPEEAGTFQTQPSDGRVYCEISLTFAQMPEYPSVDMETAPRVVAEDYAIAVQVLRVWIDNFGRVADVTLAAQTGHAALADAVMAVAPTLSVRQGVRTPPGCTVGRAVYLPIRYAIARR